MTIPTDGPACVCWPARDGSEAAIGTFRATEPARPAAIRILRRGLRRWIDEAVIDEAAIDDDTADAMVLLADEAVTNVVEHAGPAAPCSVSVVAGPRACGRGVAILVADDGRWRPLPEERGYRGRGVALMGRLAERCSITTSREGTTVRMCWRGGSSAPSG